MKIRSIGLSVLLALTGPSVLQAQDCEDVSGAWAVDLELPDGTSQDVTLTLEQTGCEITGLIEGNNQTPIESGTVDGSTFTFLATVSNQGGGQSIEIAWEGTVEGDAISGTLSAEMFGTFEFTGTRADG